MYDNSYCELLSFLSAVCAFIFLQMVSRNLSLKQCLQKTYPMSGEISFIPGIVLINLMIYLIILSFKKIHFSYIGFRDYGRLIKILEFRGIGRLRLCFEAKLARQIRKAERKRKEKKLKERLNQQVISIIY